MYSLALIILVVSEKKAFQHFPIGSNVNLCIAVEAILDSNRKHTPCRGPSNDHLVSIVLVVSEKKRFETF